MDERETLTIRAGSLVTRIVLPSDEAATVRSAVRDMEVPAGSGGRPHLIEVTPVRGGHVITADGVQWSPRPGQNLCDQLIYLLMRMSLDAERRLLHLHTGYVALQGRGIFVAGYPRSGKSTLVAALVEAGFDYLTDERVALDRELRLTPFMKPISLVKGSFGLVPHLDPGRTGAGSAGPRLWHVPASAIRAGSVASDARLDTIVFIERHDGITAETTPVHPAAMARLLLSDSPDAGRFGAGAVEIAARLCSGVQCYSLRFATASSAAPLIRELAKRPVPSEPGPRVEPLRAAGTSRRIAGAPRPAPGLTGVIVDGRALLSRPTGEIIELPEAPTAWLRLLDGRHTVEQLVEDMTSETDLPHQTLAGLARSSMNYLRLQQLVAE